MGQTGACHGEPPAHDQRPGDSLKIPVVQIPTAPLCPCVVVVFLVLFHFTFPVFPLGGSDAE